MFEKRTVKIIFWGIILLALAAYISGLYIDVTRDASKYATVSKEIYQHGNFINLTVLGQAYDQKPPMTFWLGAIGFTIGKVSNFWFKLPILLLIFAGFYWAFRLGESLYNKRVGLITAFLAGISFIYTMYSMDIHTDTPLQAFVTLALWQLYEFIKTKRNRNWILGFIAIGLAMLSKGPIGAAIPGFAVLGHILLKKDFRFLIDIRWYAGLVLAFIVVSPALIGLWNQFGFEGLKFFFWDNNIGRMTGDYTNTFNDYFFFVHGLLYLFLPWSLLFYVATFFEFRDLFRNKFKAPEYFTLAGIWIFFVILNTSKSQLPNYIFGIMPLIAVLTAKWIDRVVEQKAKPLVLFSTIQTVVAALLWVFTLLLALYVFWGLAWYYYILIAIGIGATIYVCLSFSPGIERVLIPPALTFIVLTFILNTSIYPEMFGKQAPPQAARYFNEHKKEGDLLYNYRYGSYELYFYSEPQAQEVGNVGSVGDIIKKKGSWIYTSEEGLADLMELSPKADTIIHYDHYSMRNAGLYFNPKTRDRLRKDMYLVKY